jgi:hypothetical protein
MKMVQKSGHFERILKTDTLTKLHLFFLKAICLVASFAILLISSLWADESSVFLPECSSDQSKFCAGITKPKSKITQCLLEHNDHLSESCKSSLKAFTESVRSEMKSYCMEDVAKFCRWVIPGGGRIIKCLFKNEASLSQACNKALHQ